MAKRYWLMKSEPDAFGIDDLERVRVEPWTGVRNYMARNIMRDQMLVGDDVIFYHSSADPSGPAGLARVHRTGVVDELQFDPKSKYHDEGSSRDEPRWICVDVEFVEKFPAVVPLEILRHTAGLEDMVLLKRGMRLSVQPVTAAEYKLIVAMARKGVTAAPAKPARPAKAVASRPRATRAAAKPARTAGRSRARGRRACVGPSRPCTPGRAGRRA
jgi:predicted RNA-binding protein with PUA-like domain